MIGVGFIISTWVGYGSAHVPETSSFSWRFPLAFQVVPCIIIIVGLLFFPESPRQLVENGKEDEALSVVCIHAELCFAWSSLIANSSAAFTTMVEMMIGSSKSFMRSRRLFKQRKR